MDASSHVPELPREVLGAITGGAVRVAPEVFHNFVRDLMKDPKIGLAQACAKWIEKYGANAVNWTTGPYIKK
jgi:hypothetical protein